MDKEVKPNPPFRFRRPWETPPREDEEPPPPSPPIPPIIRPIPIMPHPISAFVPVPPSSIIKMERPIKIEMENQNFVHIKVEKEEGYEEEVEVFRFDRQKLVLTSEKVKVKRESTSTENTNPPSTSSNTESKSSKKSSSSNNSSASSSGSAWSSSSNSGSSSASSTSDSEDKRIKIKKKLRRKRLIAALKCRKADTDLNVVESKDMKIKIDLEAFGDEEQENENNSNSDFDEDDSDEEFNAKLKLIEDFPEGRNKERKNSKWADYGVTRKSSRLKSTKTKFCGKSHKAQVVKKFTSLLKKNPEELNEDERESLAAFPELAEEARKRLEKRHLATERVKEEEDAEDILDKKCVRLAQVISKATYVVVFTGAGISTSALIPDYRGPNGIWTLMRKGQSIAEDLKQFPQSADPTYTHAAIKELYDRDIIKHIVSQNVDGLHIRSGIPKTALSEVHGNMYIEVCLECHREYVRLFDVTENTRRHHHKTGRSCYHCGSLLKDSVVLFGEKGSLRWPINWAGAEYHVDKADVILCLGSSLKVLRRYPWLWGMSKPANQRPKLYIVNLQWTPKDRFAALKINGRCDEVISKIMDNLQIPVTIYKRELDPIFSIATLLHPTESSTRRSKDLNLPEGIPYPPKSTDLRNYIKFEPIFCKEVRALNQVKRKVVDGEDEDTEKDILNQLSKPKSCGLGGWLGNAVNVKPKKKKVK